MEFLRLLWAPIRSRLQYDGCDIGGSRSSRSTGIAEALNLVSLANHLNVSTTQRLDSDPVVSELRWKYINEFREIVRLALKLDAAIFQTPLYNPLDSIIKIADEDVDAKLEMMKEGLLLDIEIEVEKMKEDPLLKPYIDVVQGRLDLVVFSMTAAQVDWFSDRARDNLQDNVYSLEDIGNLIEELYQAFLANPVSHSNTRLLGSFDDLTKVIVFLVKALQLAYDSAEKGCLAVKFGKYLLTPVFQEEMKNLIYNYSKCSLHEAAGTGDIEMLQKLLEDGTNKDNKDWTGKTTLHYGCHHNFGFCISGNK